MVILELYMNPGSVSFQIKERNWTRGLGKKRVVAIVQDFSLVTGKSWHYKSVGGFKMLRFQLLFTWWTQAFFPMVPNLLFKDEGWESKA